MLPNKTIISVLHAALIVYITECREVDDADGEMYARQAQAWLDAQTQSYSHRNGETHAPTEPGGYWIKYPTLGVFALVQVWRNSYDGYLYCDQYNEDYNCMEEVSPQDYGNDLRWYGPIPEPEEFREPHELNQREEQP